MLWRLMPALAGLYLHRMSRTDCVVAHSCMLTAMWQFGEALLSTVLAWLTWLIKGILFWLAATPASHSQSRRF